MFRCPDLLTSIIQTLGHLEDYHLRLIQRLRMQGWFFYKNALFIVRTLSFSFFFTTFWVLYSCVSGLKILRLFNVSWSFTPSQSLLIHSHLADTSRTEVALMSSSASPTAAGGPQGLPTISAPQPGRASSLHQYPLPLLQKWFSLLLGSYQSPGGNKGW